MRAVARNIIKEHGGVLIAAAVVFAAVLFLVFLPEAANAGRIDTGFSTSVGASRRGNDGSGVSVVHPGWLAIWALQAVIRVVGVVFLIILIGAGLLWMTAAGNEEKIAKSKKMIVSGVIGLILVFGSWSITEVVFTALGETRVADECSESDTACRIEACLTEKQGVLPACDDGFYFDEVVCDCQPVIEADPDAADVNDEAVQQFEECLEDVPEPPDCGDDRHWDPFACTCVDLPE